MNQHVNNSIRDPGTWGVVYIVFFSSRRRHTRYWRDWSSDVCSSDLSDEALADPYHAHVTFTYDFFRWRHMRGVITDQHVVARKRLGRTLVFVARQLKDGRAREVLAVAVNERTSVVVDRRGLARVVGEGPAYFILGDHAPEVCEPKRPLTYTGYKVWKLAPGSTFDLARRPAKGFTLVNVTEGKPTDNLY